MAQTNFTPISLYYSATAAAVPTAGNLVAGELAINTADGKLFYKDSAGVVQTIASKDINSGVFPAGTVSAPSITFTGDTNTGIYSPAADTIAFTEGGVESMRVNSSGNLGIGTASPACRLDVNRGSAGLLANFTDGVNTNFQIGTTSLLATIGPSAGSTAMAFKTGDTERMRITSAGLVQILASSTNSTFTGGGDLAIKNSSSNPYMSWHNTAGDRYGYIQANSTSLNMQAESGYLSLGSITGEAMRIISGGNVGIGTSSPSRALEVNGLGKFLSTVTIGGTAGSTDYNGYFTNQSFANNSNNTTVTVGTLSQPLIFATNVTERMRITAGGDIGINNSSPANRLDVIGSTGADACQIKTTNSSTAINLILWNAVSSGDNVFTRFATDTTLTARGGITYNRAGGLVVYGTTSDYRAKDIIGSVLNSGEVIDSVPVYMGKMKGATQTRPMFIAHETPDYAHTGEKDAVDKDGNPAYQQMDVSSLVPVLWAEVQSLRKRLALLESK